MKELREINGGWKGQNDRGRSLKEVRQPEFSEEVTGSFCVVGYTFLFANCLTVFILVVFCCCDKRHDRNKYRVGKGLF